MRLGNQIDQIIEPATSPDLFRFYSAYVHTALLEEGQRPPREEANPACTEITTSSELTEERPQEPVQLSTDVQYLPSPLDANDSSGFQLALVSTSWNKCAPSVAKTLAHSTTPVEGEQSLRIMRTFLKVHALDGEACMQNSTHPSFTTDSVTGHRRLRTDQPVRSLLSLTVVIVSAQIGVELQRGRQND